MSVELTDVTEKRREDRRLRALVERERALSAQYQELSRQKDDFVASISHELRTPLASIVGYAETLDETELDPLQRRFVDTIVRNAGRLQERVEELLSAAKRAADSVDDPHPLSVGRIIGEVADDLRAVAASRGVGIVVEPSASVLPEVIGTEDSVTRVLTNIMSNAVKFSPNESAVVVSALVDDETVELFVRDAGPGIPLADQGRVFDRFYRTEDATANATPGTGLGLSIVRTLLDGIGGSVLVQSDGRSGSTFVIRFQRAHDLDPAD
nr:HAMP domain-containing sensor histidine kinase [Microcella alkalica]